jgi:hypothetical protein
MLDLKPVNQSFGLEDCIVFNFYSQVLWILLLFSTMTKAIQQRRILTMGLSSNPWSLATKGAKALPSN